MEFKDKRILIIGAGLSGTAAAGLLSGSGADIILYDDNSSINKEDIIAKLPKNYTGRLVLGDIPEECREGLDFIILSPGVPKDLPYITLMQQKGTKVIGEVELAYYYSKGRVIAVTGTNGKTTTTALTGEIIKTCYEHTFVVGNIGTPYTEMVRYMTEDSVTVAEMSSFQLDTIETFRPNVSMILNITPDHLNRHHNMRNYIAAKCNIAKNQLKDDICILNYEDTTLREAREGLTTDVVWFSSKRKLDKGMYLSGDSIIYNDGSRETEIIKTDEMQLIGVHNYENVMAAVAAAIYMKIPFDMIKKAIAEFKPVEHRIEYVATKKGVKYYNDSKGTNPDASIQAVKAMKTPTILIGGGYDKNSDYTEWIECFGNKIKCLVLMGQTKYKIADCAEKLGYKNIVMVEDMKEAVEYSAAHTVPGESVLLSPCCASWGMFKNYEERGRIFKELVINL